MQPASRRRHVPILVTYSYFRHGRIWRHHDLVWCFVVTVELQSILWFRILGSGTSWSVHVGWCILMWADIKFIFMFCMNIAAISKMLLAWQILYVWRRAASPQKWKYSSGVNFCLWKLCVRSHLHCKRQFHVTFFPEGVWPSVWGNEEASVMASLKA